MDETREQRSLASLNILQGKVESVIQGGKSELEIAIAVQSRDWVIGWHEEEFPPVTLDPKTGKWK